MWSIMDNCPSGLPENTSGVAPSHRRWGQWKSKADAKCLWCHHTEHYISSVNLAAIMWIVLRYLSACTWTFTLIIIMWQLYFLGSINTDILYNSASVGNVNSNMEELKNSDISWYFSGCKIGGTALWDFLLVNTRLKKEEEEAEGVVEEEEEE